MVCCPRVLGELGRLHALKRQRVRPQRASFAGEGTLTLSDEKSGEVRHVKMDPEFPVWLARQVVDVVPRV